MHQLPMRTHFIRHSTFIDIHGEQSMNVIIICGPYYEFFAINANWPGSVHDYRFPENLKFILALKTAIDLFLVQLSLVTVFMGQ